MAPKTKPAYPSPRGRTPASRHDLAIRLDALAAHLSLLYELAVHLDGYSADPALMNAVATCLAREAGAAHRAEWHPPAGSKP